MQNQSEALKRHAGALAVHCKAGLGRTGVLICAYMIKHYGFTAEEAMGYIRICRPGSVIGPQQNYLIAKAQQLVLEGKAYRDAKRVRATSSNFFNFQPPDSSFSFYTLSEWG